MMLRLVIVPLVLMLLLPVTVNAQDEPETTPDLAATAAAAAEAARAAAEDVEDVLAEVSAIADDVEKVEDRAFNLLSLFEAFGLVLSVVAVTAGFVAVRRLNAALKNIEDTRDTVEGLIKHSQTQDEHLREQVEQVTAQISRQNQTEITRLQQQLEANADELQRRSQQANLALALLPLGEAQYKSQDLRGALAVYQQALELDPANPIIHYRIGYVYTQIGELPEAKDHLLQALNAVDSFPPALAALGYVQRRIGEKMPLEDPERGIILADAEQKLRLALKVSPRLVDEDGESWWGSLGGLLRRRGQIEEAIEAYKQGTKVTPASSYPFSNLAMLYMRQGKRDDMLETFKSVEQLAAREARADENNYWGYADWLVASLALGKNEEAEEVLPAALTAAPADSPYALESLNTTLEQLAAMLESDQAVIIRSVIERIRQFAERRAQESPPGAD